MKKIITSIAFVIIMMNAYAQTAPAVATILEKNNATIGKQLSAIPVVTALDGNGRTLLAGASMSSLGDLDMLIVKEDSNGDTLWTRHYGGLGDDYATALITDDTGNVIFTGVYVDSTIRKVYTAKLDSNGVEDWHKIFRGAGIGNAGTSVIADDSGYVYVGGGSIQSLTTMGDIMLIKYSEIG